MLKSVFDGLRDMCMGRGSSTITPNDGTDLLHPITGEAHIALQLFVESAGTVAIICPDGTTDSYTLTAAGPITAPCKRVKATGTTGGLVIHAIW